MWVDTITAEDVKGRSRVGEIAHADPSAALKVARSIKHPWYRCQSLATVSEHLAGSQKLQVLLEALTVAREQSEINRIVTVSAWPIRHLASIDPELTAQHVKALVALCNKESHNLRRADALQALAWSVAEQQALLKLVVPSLVRALRGGWGWRIDRAIRNSIEYVYAVEPESAAELIKHHAENGKKRKWLDSVHIEPLKGREI